jgi:hypothetical protein
LKVSSKSGAELDSGSAKYFETESLLKVTNFSDLLPLNLLDRIGTAIALGEAGDLSAAHEFRIKNAGK